MPCLVLAGLGCAGGAAGAALGAELQPAPPSLPGCCCRSVGGKGFALITGCSVSSAPLPAREGHVWGGFPLPLWIARLEISTRRRRGVLCDIPSEPPARGIHPSRAGTAAPTIPPCCQSEQGAGGPREGPHVCPLSVTLSPQCHMCVPSVPRVCPLSATASAVQAGGSGSPALGGFGVPGLVWCAVPSLGRGLCHTQL